MGLCCFPRMTLWLWIETLMNIWMCWWIWLIKAINIKQLLKKILTSKLYILLLVFSFVLVKTRQVSLRLRSNLNRDVVWTLKYAPYPWIEEDESRLDLFHLACSIMMWLATTSEPCGVSWENTPELKRLTFFNWWFNLTNNSSASYEKLIYYLTMKKMC